MSEEVLERFAQSGGGIAFAAVLGLLWGSFGNVAIARVPAGESVVRPPSRCGSCGAAIRWYDNVPLLSWILLRGRCRACGARFSVRYLAVEALTGLLFALAWWVCFQAADPFGVRVQRFVSYAAFALCLVVLSFIDLDHKKIPDKITYPAIPIFLLLGLLLRDRPWYDCLIGIAVGYGVVRAISDGYYWITKREGLGYGDGKLLAIVGGLLGWHAALFALFGGAVLGSVIGVAAILATRRRGEGGTIRHVELPFGPFLATAALAYMYLEGPIERLFAGVFATG